MGQPHSKGSTDLGSAFRAPCLQEAGASTTPTGSVPKKFSFPGHTQLITLFHTDAQLGV